MSHPNGYTKEMIKEMLGSSWPQQTGESGNVTRRRIGQEIRDGIRPKRTYPPNKKYVYPEGHGFNYMQWLKDNPNSTEAGTYGSKVS